MKQYGWFVYLIATLLAMVGCSAEESGAYIAPTDESKWAIYWYLCGSDLESTYGSATDDLLELLDVTMPDNVKVYIQTGGTTVWQNDLVDSYAMERYVYDQEGLRFLETVPSASMGASTTLEDFLSFGKRNFPAEHTAVVFWNHGGGSVSGVAFDELYSMDSLSLSEMYEAFVNVFGENPNDQPIDIIGFDTCLMATVDTAFTFSDIGKYLVASQEVEPGNGWYYSGWIGALAENPDVDPLTLSTIICDTYVEGCELVGSEDNITLSVTDLSKVPALIEAYDNFGKEALATAVENPAFFARFSQIANSVENYGGNTREQGFTNMTDLGNLARKSQNLLPETAQTVADAIDECVAYKVNGIYRPESAGLSCYYSYNGDMNDFSAYMNIGPSDAIKYLYSFGLTGELSDDGMSYLAAMNYNELPDLLTLNSVDWQDMPLTVDDEGCATLTLGPQAIDILASLNFDLYYTDVDEDIMLCLGSDNDIISDWENGVFKDNFRGVWGSIDGALCYMELSFEGENYNQYSVPILLNGEDYNLMVIYDFNEEQYFIEGARKPLGDSGAADKNLRILVEGDEIQTIHYATALSSDDDDLTAVAIDTIIVTPELTFAETELGDGMFVMIFTMTDSQGNFAFSDSVIFETIDGEIFTTV